MRQRSKRELDKIDLTIIQELARDGRMPVMHLAAKARISQRAARSRLQRIISEGIIKVVAVPLWQFTDLRIETSVGFNVKPGYNVHTVAEKLASHPSSHPSFRSVALTSGPYEIVTWAWFDSLGALSSFLRNEVGNIPGISSNETLIHLEMVKNVASPDKYEPARHDTKSKKKYIPDRLDTLLIEELQKDGRMPVVELAKKLGVSRISAAKRLQRLLSERAIEVIAVSEPASLGYEVTARIGIKVFPGTVDDVAHKLASFSAVHFVAITVGHYDILLGVHFSDLHELSSFMRDGLSGIPNIAKTENMVYLEIIKSPWDFAE